MASLRGFIDASVTSIEIDDTTSFPTNGGVVEVDTELIRYTYATDKAIINCERGYNGTTPATHDDKTLADLQDTAVPPYSLQEFSDVVAPVDHFTGVGVAFTGCRFTLLTNGSIFTNTGDETDPIWTLLQAGSDLGITQLTGDVTAGPGNGSQVATLADGVVTAVKIDSETATVGQVLTADGAGAATWEDGSTAAASGPAGAVQLSDGAGNFVRDTSLNFTRTNGYPSLEMGDGTEYAQFAVVTPNSGGLSIYEPAYAKGLGFLTATVTPTNVFTMETDHGDVKIKAVNLDAPGTESITLDAPIIKNGAGVSILNPNTQVLFDGGSAASIDANNRFLLDGLGGTQLDWSQPDIITLPGTTLVLQNTGPGITLQMQASNASFLNFTDDAGSTVYSTIQVGGDTNGSTQLELGTGNSFVVTNSYHVPDASAMLDVFSSTQGFLPPRMDTTARDAISSPAAGLMIYNTTTNKLNVYTTAWETVTSV